MNNPFESINAKLSSIESLLIDIKHPTVKDATEPSEQLVGVKGAAKKLRLSAPTIYSKVSRREIPFMKRGNRLYFSSIELEKYIKDGKVKSYAELNQSAENYVNKKGL